MGLERETVENTTPENQVSDLGFQFQFLKFYKSQRPKGFRFYPFGFTCEANYLDKSIIATGEDFSEDIAIAKTISELMERAIMLDYFSNISKLNLDLIKPTTSNGWAAHPVELEAKIRAVFELLERDAVLTQWYSQTPFFEINTSSLSKYIRSWVEQELSLSEFPNLKVLISTEGIGPSVTCLLLNSEGFGVCGHSSGTNLEKSIESAIGEACRAAQLTLRKMHWQDSLILKNGHTGKINPGAHAVFYAYHEPFPQWMFGKIISWQEALDQWKQKIKTVLEYKINDFIIQTVSENPVFVSYATNSKAIELTWGVTDSNRILFLKRYEILKNKTINTRPHIIS